MQHPLLCHSLGVCNRSAAEAGGVVNLQLTGGVICRQLFACTVCCSAAQWPVACRNEYRKRERARAGPDLTPLHRRPWLRLCCACWPRRSQTDGLGTARQLVLLQCNDYTGSKGWRDWWFGWVCHTRCGPMSLAAQEWTCQPRHGHKPWRCCNSIPLAPAER
jgi:hypothetical protein